MAGTRGQLNSRPQLDPSTTNCIRVQFIIANVIGTFVLFTDPGTNTVLDFLPSNRLLTIF
jgi:hypothetical protein